MSGDIVGVRLKFLQDARQVTKSKGYPGNVSIAFPCQLLLTTLNRNYEGIGFGMFAGHLA